MQSLQSLWKEQQQKKSSNKVSEGTARERRIQ